jgi:hypothetical protein
VETGYSAFSRFQAAIKINDQRSGSGEAYTMTALAGGEAESQGDVSLAGATVPEE